MLVDTIKVPDNVEEKYDNRKRRWYVADGIKMASITTILKETDREGQLALEAWRNRMGHDIARMIGEDAAATGNKWHNFCEKYVLGEDIAPFLASPYDVVRASAIAHMLNHRVVRIVATETRVANKKLRAAGRMDMVVQLHNGKYAILDFKTGGKRAKGGNRLVNYLIQCTFYADAVSEIAGIDVEYIIIAQLLENELLWQVSKPQHYRDLLVAKVADFYRRHDEENTNADVPVAE